MDNNNPYTAPKASLRTGRGQDELDLLAEPRKLEAGAGWQWITNAWQMFKAEPLMWVAMTAGFFVLLMLLSALPVIGVLAGFLSTFFIAGFIIAADEQYRGERLSFSQLFAGFETNPVQLLILALLYMVASFAAIIPGVLIMGAGLAPALLSGGDMSALAQGTGMLGVLLGALVIFAVYFLVLMAYWFAPALVVLHDVNAVDALKISFRACLRNILPFFIFGLIMFGLMLVATIPLFLGWFVLLPVLMLTYYTSYRSVLTANH